METFVRLYWRPRSIRLTLVQLGLGVARLISRSGKSLRKILGVVVGTLANQSLQKQIGPGLPTVEVERNYELELKLRGY